MGKIIDTLNQKMSLSFEVFPPKEKQSLEQVLHTLDHLYSFKPDFCSVTCGAGGTNRGQNEAICEAIAKSGHTAMAHITCIGSTRADIESTIKRYQTLGVENILALRGDLPEGWTNTGGDFSFALDLLRFARQVNADMCIGVTCNPETHIESKSLDEDIMHLRMKADAGADFCVTQLFYDNEAFYRYRDHMYEAGIDLPIVVGVMPVLNKNGVLRMTLSNGGSIPAKLSRIFAKYQDQPEEFAKAGRDFTIEQIANLISHNIDGLHLYSLNKWEIVTEILQEVGIRR